jgi:hypothetical protein
MTVYVRSNLFLAFFMFAVTAAIGQDPAGPRRAAVELRWVECERIEGLTENEGFQSSCDPDDIVYPHRKPALVLTGAEVSEARLTSHEFAGRENYLVALHLTKEARDKLAASCKGNEMRLLTVVVNGKFWGVHRYEKDKTKPFVPTQARAETFLPDVGFFSSKAEAERLVSTFK